VLPIEDSLDSILTTARHAALVHASGGGTGFSFSRLRPKGDVVSSTGGTTSGPVSFMQMYNAVTGVIQQGGSRRGANIGVLRVDHPDIEEFITCKLDGGLTNFNISVGITDQFMVAVRMKSQFNLVNPRTGESVRQVSAADLWDKIVQSAWACGDPGLLFLDQINQRDTTPQMGKIETTNPCGEQPLHPYESCVLGHINLIKLVRQTAGGPEIDFDYLQQIVRLAVRFLDDVISVSEFPLPEITQVTQSSRRIGLGIMGWADLLFKLNIAYGSQESYDLASMLISAIYKDAHRASLDLGKERGVAEQCQKSPIPELQGRRNATLLTIAPTGTTSIIAGVSSGIEPAFALVYERRILDGKVFDERNPVLEEIIGDDEDLWRAIKANGGKLTGIPEMEHLSSVFVTASELDYKAHIAMQAAFQAVVDSSVSKTINMPHSATPEMVNDAFFRAYFDGCKGITIYRDGCKQGQVLSTSNTAEPASQMKPSDPDKGWERGEVLDGRTFKIPVGCGNCFVTVNTDDTQNPRELFAVLGKAGGCAASQTEAIGRLISTALQYGVPAKTIIHQLQGISCHLPSFSAGHGRVDSCADAIAKVLTIATSYEVAEHYNMIGACPQCGGTITNNEGCPKCTACGFKTCA